MSETIRGFVPPPPPSIVFSPGGKTLVTLRPDGTLEYGPEYTPDAAAKVFWEAIAEPLKSSRAELAAAQHDIDAYRGELGYPVRGDHDGRLTDGTIPINGMSGAKGLLLEAAQQREAVLARIAKAAEELRQAHFSDPPHPDRYGDAFDALFAALKLWVKEPPSE